MKRFTLPLTTFLLLMAVAVNADTQSAPKADAAHGLKVSTYFDDHMVLQRGKAVPVWGWASAGAKVTVRFAGQEHSAVAGKDGRWTVMLTSLTASAQGQTLKITEGKNALEIKGVLVGEVWVCSGQSNMAYAMSRAGYVNPDSRKKGRDHGSPKGIPKGFDPSKYSLIRQFKASMVKRPQLVDPVNVGQWSVCSKEAVAGFTAVGFFFAMELHDELNVPIGLLNCSKGSTRVESWTTNGNMYLSQIKPLLPQAIRGAIWYQGEHNAGGPDGYGDKLASLITGWRKDFNQGDFPFYIVQLPDFCDPNPDAAGGDGWARIREEQFKVTQTTVNTGIAVITDTGLVDNAHPDDKVTVGHRLAQWALAKDYGRKDVVYSGPLFKELKIEENKAIVSFDSTGAGLMVGAKETMTLAQEVKDTAPGGFAIAGADKVWHWAEARIDGYTIILTCDNVASPIAVRYGFSGNPVRCNLYNRAGLPTAPFRTDNWNIPVEVVQDLRGMKARRAAEAEQKRKAAEKKVPDDRVIDAVDLAPLLWPNEAQGHYDSERLIAIYQYRGMSMGAMRRGKWKIVLPHNYRGEIPLSLFDMTVDPGESNNLAEKHPEVVEMLMKDVEAFQRDLGQTRKYKPGSNVRPIGRVEANENCVSAP